MDIIGIILLLAGSILCIFYSFVLLIRAFQTSIWWGLGYLFVPFVSLVFLIIHWDVAKKPFLMSLLGILISIGGMLLSPAFQNLPT